MASSDSQDDVNDWLVIYRVRPVESATRRELHKGHWALSLMARSMGMSRSFIKGDAESRSTGLHRHVLYVEKAMAILHE